MSSLTQPAAAREDSDAGSLAPAPGGAAASAARIADLGVLVGGTPADEAAIAYAETIADAFDAHLEVFLANHIGLPPLPAAPGAEALAAQIVEQGRHVGEAAEKLLRERLARLAVSWELRREDGTFGDLVPKVVRMSGTCDLVVIAQQTILAGESDLLEAVVFAARSRALIVPGDPARAMEMPETVLVGWRDTPECAHAVAAALPFLQRAGLVVLASVAEEGSAEQRKLEPMADMARHLARHGVRVETRELPNWRHAAEGLMHEAEAVGAQMIVIGAYGHSRMRELLLGGVTRELLRKSRLPLFVAR